MIATDLEEFIEQKIASGIYRSRDELVAAAVAALRDDDEFQSKLEQRIAESDRGLSTPLDIEAIKQRFAASIQQDESPLSHDPRVLKTPSAERDLLEVADFIYRKRTEMNTDTEEFIQRKVASGQFQSRDEVIEEALEVYQDIDETDDVRDEIQRRLKDAEAGNIVLFDFEELRQDLRAELARRRAGRQ